VKLPGLPHAFRIKSYNNRQPQRQAHAALNGVRITIVDFWPESTVLQHEIFYAVMALFAAIFVPSAYVMLGRLFE